MYKQFRKLRHPVLTFPRQHQVSMLDLVKKLQDHSDSGESKKSETRSLVVDTFRKRHSDSKWITRIRHSASSYEVRLSFGTFRISSVSYFTRDKTLLSPGLAVVNIPGHNQITVSFIPEIFNASLWEWAFVRSFGSWKVNLQSLNVRPGWSPIFKFATRGDIKNVRKLIAEGLASPNDVEHDDGWTVLHVSYSCINKLPANSHKVCSC